MRFIKKASLKNLNEVSESYKEIELYTIREDFSSNEKIEENISVIKKNYEENKAVITVIHCPSSRWKTSLDELDISTNYMSWCEVVANENEKDLLLKVCKFTKEISEIYNQSISKGIESKSEIEEDDFIEDENMGSEFTPVKIILILHTGCILGCTSRDELEGFVCQFKLSEKNKCFQNELKTNTDNNKVKTLVREIMEYETVQIAFENITPFYDGTNVGSNSGYGYDNFILAKKLNAITSESNNITSRKSNNKFGVVVDFCHLFATNQLLNIEKNDIQYLDFYFKDINESDKKLIMLFHLSNYKDGNHGESFTEIGEDQDKIHKIRQLCYEYARTAPITLEVTESDVVDKGINNFNKMMLEWSKLHILLADRISQDLYNFFENLFYVYSNQYNKINKLKILKSSFEIKEYVLLNSYSGKTLFDFIYDGQKLNVHLFQLHSYIYYMRYCNLALDLMQKYEYEFDITEILKHYIFNDELEEIKFDGLGCYYNIYWIKNNATLFRCYDSVKPKTNTFTNFKDILKACFKHIDGNELQFLSFGKAFGRVMLKYFNPKGTTDEKGTEYNVEVFRNAPINCCFINNETLITLQEFQDREEKDFCNFSIDFCDFYNRRGDTNKDASLKELYEKTSEKNWVAEKIGSIYDQEVIFYNYTLIETNKYFLSKEDFVIMMVAYQIFFDINKNDKKYKENIDVCEIVDAVCNKKDDILNFMFNQHDKINYNKINLNSIREILKTVDFYNEVANPINFNNECYSDFTRSIKDVIKEINNTELYKTLYNKIKKERESESSY